MATFDHNLSWHLEIIHLAPQKKCEVGRILGSSGLGLVPKHDGGWPIICHLLAPALYNINDYIDPNSFSLTYCTIDDAYSIINKLGTNALLSKIDHKGAFRLIPVRPEGWNLLGIQWFQRFYADTCQPFGLRSIDSFLLNRISDAIH